jgi:hypothetical protein
MFIIYHHFTGKNRPREYHQDDVTPLSHLLPIIERLIRIDRRDGIRDVSQFVLIDFKVKRDHIVDILQ